MGIFQASRGSGNVTNCSAELSYTSESCGTPTKSRTRRTHHVFNALACVGSFLRKAHNTMHFASLSQACAPFCGSTTFFSLLATQVHLAVGVQLAGGECSRTDVSQTVHLGCARVRLRSSRVLCTQRQPLFASQGGAASATYAYLARATGFTRCSDRQPAATLASSPSPAFTSSPSHRASMAHF